MGIQVERELFCKWRLKLFPPCACSSCSLGPNDCLHPADGRHKTVRRSYRPPLKSLSSERPSTYWLLSLREGFPGGTSGKEPTCQCRGWSSQSQRRKRCGFDPWVGKIPCRRAWQPTPVFLPGKSHGQRSLTGYSLQSHTESE